jgi:RNA polymerase sigma-70 factor (ECF subfamily)
MRKFDVAAHPPEGTESESSGYAARRDTADERLAALYRQHSGPLLNYMARLTLGDRRLAEDIVQETYLRAWHLLRNQEADLPRDDGDPQDAQGRTSARANAGDAMRGWLFTVARRVLIDALRKRCARPAEVFVDLRHLPGYDDEIERMLVGQAVRAGLKELRSEHRDVLVESYYLDRSLREIAALLNIPEGTVKSRTYYGLRALRGVVERQAAS